ncbi:hypothetical protein NDU88_010322 [Pleurodeles waltl]|uniref:Uncharacterized protein n=1 Tax=Pleurodeles waltl TaxID=8319 RepID=A0AAV7RYZ3_PLEWA|nr:hypothetical protein NDU88_010322 [Pleurodeles waltl]
MNRLCGGAWPSLRAWRTRAVRAPRPAYPSPLEGTEELRCPAGGRTRARAALKPVGAENGPPAQPAAELCRAQVGRACRPGRRDSAAALSGLARSAEAGPLSRGTLVMRSSCGHRSPGGE